MNPISAQRWYRLVLDRSLGLPLGDIVRVPGASIINENPTVIRSPENAAPLLCRVVAQECGAQVVRVDLLGPPAPQNVTYLDFLSPEINDFARERLAKTPFQQQGIVYNCVRQGSLIRIDAGGGKTICSIASATATPGPIIFVSSSAGRWHVSREITRYTSLTEEREEILILEGEKPIGLPRKLRFVVVTWELIVPWLDMLLKLKPATVVFDEIHRAQSAKRSKAVPLPTQIQIGSDGQPLPVIQRFRREDLRNTASAVRKISRATRRRIGLSATPIRDRIRNLWAPLDILDPKGWGWYSQFTRSYCSAAEGSHGWDDTGKSGTRELAERLQHLVYEVPRAVSHAELPSSRSEVIYLPVSQQNAPSGGWKNDPELKELRSQMRQNPSALLELALRKAASVKRDFICDRVSEAVAEKQKVVIYTGRRKDVDAWAHKLKEKLKGVPVWAGHGGVSDRERDRMASEYMETKEAAVLVCTGYSMGQSIELQTTDLMIFAQLPWSPGDLKQWMGRATRKGQDRPVLWFFVVAIATADERVAQVLIRKIEDVYDVWGDSEDKQHARALMGLGDPDKVLDSMVAKLAEDPRIKMGDFG